MKKRILFISVIMCLLVGGTVLAEGSDIVIKIDGETVILEQEAFIKDSRTMVPLRGLFEKLDIVVDYNKETKQVIAKTDQLEIVMNIGEDIVLINGQVNSLDVGTLLMDDRTYVPLRFVAENFGFEVGWDGTKREVSINDNGGLITSTLETLPTIDSKENMAALLHYNNSLSQYVRGGGSDVIMFNESVDSEAATSAPQESDSSGSEKAVDFSDTNTQVTGVQESDIVKTDGNYIYKVIDNKVSVFSIDPKQLEVISTITLKENNISGIFLGANRLVVYGSNYNYGIEPFPVEPMLMESEMSIMPYYNKNETFVKVYDLTTIEKPKLVKDYSFDGNYISGRLIDNKLYVVTNKNIWFDFIMYRTDEKYTDSIKDEDVLPSYRNNLTGEEFIIGYEKINYFPDNVRPSYMLTIGLDIETEDDILDVDAYLGSAGQMYVSQENLYTALTTYNYNVVESKDSLFRPVYDINTVIYKFNIVEGQVDYTAAGKVKGTILNQFSMDEYNSNFRVATMKERMWFEEQSESENNIYILNNKMETIGELNGIAPGERIYSTRFVNDKIYMVTFKQVDPFFVIDATIPEAPKVLGYLKVPGFSTYMHPMDEGHILGFGQETEEKEDGRVITTGFKISLFNVEDFENPYEQDKLVIGTSGTYSELLYNHKALMYDYNKGVMGLPLSVSETQAYRTDYVGAYVFDISTEDVEVRGRVTHHKIEDAIVDYFDWNYTISRLMYIEDNLYTFSNNKMVVYDLQSLEYLGELMIKE